MGMQKQCDLFRQSYFHVSYRRRIPATFICPRQSIGRSCQSTEIATLLKSIYFVFKISFLPKYRVIYYDYTVKWCSLINCNWCVWLDIVYIWALSINNVSHIGLYLKGSIIPLRCLECKMISPFKNRGVYDQIMTLQ